MSQRIQVGRIDPPKIVRPTATPRDTYVAPQRQGVEEQLADALSSVAPSLARFAGVLGQQKGQQEREAGEAAARDMAAQGKQFTDAVKAGTIRKDQSPWFRVGFYETAGRASGGKYIGDFLEALGKSPVSESVEVADFDKFEQEFRATWTKNALGEKPDPFLANAFGTTADGQITNLRNEFARNAGARMVKLNDENFHAEIFQKVQTFDTNDTPLAERIAEIRLAQDRQVATGGMTFDQVNKKTAQAVAAAAIRLRDTTILDILDAIPTDAKSKGVLGGTSYGAELRREAESAISRAVDDDARREEVKVKREREQGIKTISGGLVDALSKDPGANIDTYITEMRKIDPTYIPTLYNLRDAISDGYLQDDPNVVRGLTMGIHTAQPGSGGYTTRRDLDRALGSRQMTLETYRTLSNELEQRDAAGGSGKFLRNPILTDIANETHKTFVSEYPDGLVTPAVRMNAQAAADEAEYLMLQWLQKNPEATPETILTTKTAIRERVVRSRIGLQAKAENASGQDQSAVSKNIKPAQFFVADPIQAGQMSRELQEIQEGKRNGFSSLFLSTLRANRIDPTNLQAVDKFLKDQQTWITSTSPKP